MNISKIFVLSLFCFCLSAEARVSVPKFFSDNAVLQREAAIPVWGWASPNEKIRVRFNKQSKSTIADTNGKWSLKLKPEKAGGPFSLNIEGENAIEIKNVLVGEVWLCSGQSNMEWTVGLSMNAEQELANSENPNIRHIKITRTVNTLPQRDIREGTWKLSNPINTKDFSAIGYFFARDLYKELKVPIGLINSTWGGTNIETWISREGFESSDEFREMISRIPKLDIDSLTESNVRRKAKYVEGIQGVELNHLDAKAFMQTSFDDSRLPTLSAPAQWESQILGNIDGVVWLRKTVSLTAEQSRKSAILELAKIDDDDISFVNGVEVGRTNRWNAQRRYQIPPGVLTEGKNTVVVRVTDGGGGGGIYGDSADLKINLGDENVSLVGSWKFQVESIMGTTGENEFPSLAFNAMINPLIPYSFRGVLWYQGESNAGRAYQYRKAFPLLINDWRKKWNVGNFPFYFVQLATFKTDGNSNNGDGWSELREAQTQTLLVPNTGMVVTTDIGNPLDVHPINKQEVGKRLAALAFNRIYKKRMIDSGPVFKSMKIAGDKVVVSFENIGSGLITAEKNDRVRGFEVAGSDQIFYEATGILQGNEVVLSSERVGSPVAVRFGWIGDASANNLFNKEGFPAVPFRSDDWKTITKNAKYTIADF